MCSRDDGEGWGEEKDKLKVGKGVGGWVLHFIIHNWHQMNS